MNNIEKNTKSKTTLSEIEKLRLEVNRLHRELITAHKFIETLDDPDMSFSVGLCSHSGSKETFEDLFEVFKEVYM